MKVWWCEEHGERGYVPEVRGQTDPHCWVRDMGPASCRMVEMRLVPVDALVIGSVLPVFLEQRRNDDLRAAIGKGLFAPWEQDIERLLNRGDSILDALASQVGESE